MKIKIICGFNEDQKYTIEANEVHKAYYLFRNPEKRGVFSNGIALTGRDIRAIQPDYHATMGWNPTHKLDSNDWIEINNNKVTEKFKDVMALGSLVASKIEQNPAYLNTRLSEIKQLLPKSESNNLLNGINKLIN